MTKKDRDAGSVHVSIRLPSDLVEQIDKLAEDERRIRTQMIRILLEDAIEDRLTK